MPIGPVEMVIVLVIVLLIFGPKKVPELGNSLGRSIREFKAGIAESDETATPAKPSAATAEKANSRKPEVASQPTVAAITSADGRTNHSSET